MSQLTEYLESVGVFSRLPVRVESVTNIVQVKTGDTIQIGEFKGVIVSHSFKGSSWVAWVKVEGSYLEEWYVAPPSGKIPSDVIVQRVFPV